METQHRQYFYMVSGFSLKNTSLYTCIKFFSVSSKGRSQYVLNSCRQKLRLLSSPAASIELSLTFLTLKLVSSQLKFIILVLDTYLLFIRIVLLQELSEHLFGELTPELREEIPRGYLLHSRVVPLWTQSGNCEYLVIDNVHLL